MINAPSLWVASVMLAGALHAAGTALLIWMTLPDPAEQAPAPERRLELAVMAVPQAEARGSRPQSDVAEALAPQETALSGGAVPVVSAIARVPDELTASGETPTGAPAPAASTGATVLAPEPARAGRAAIADPREVLAPTVPAPRSEPVSGLQLPADSITEGRLPERIAAASAAPAPTPVPVAATESRPADAVAPQVGSVRVGTGDVRVTKAVAVAGLAEPALPSKTAGSERAVARLPAGTAAPPASPVAQAVADARPTSVTSAALRPSPAAAPAVAVPQSRPAVPVAPSAERSDGAPVPEVATSEAPPTGDQAAERIPTPAPAALAAPDPERTKAALAWTGGAATPLSPEALDVIDALMSGGPVEGAETLRDGIGGILAAADCARVQTAFRPESGELELVGHVPDAKTGALIADAVRTEIGGALPVVSRLRTLPPPQCTVLSELTAAGLPQSTEQFTNPLIIGPDSFARVYDFRSGETMQLDLGGADYDAWLYLDYYDSSGQVTHLVPNDVVPPTRLKAEAVATFGGGSADITGGRVRLVIGPPYGQDIAVAMVSSVPLFDDLRPLSEDASSYLTEVGRRVADLRKTDPDLKIEWVYLFVETTP